MVLTKFTDLGAALQHDVPALSDDDLAEMTQRALEAMAERLSRPARRRNGVPART